jgi:hypothetical protein
VRFETAPGVQIQVDFGALRRAVHEDILDFWVCNCNLGGITPFFDAVGS